MSYTPPVKDMQFVINELAGFEDLLKIPAWSDLDADTATAVLEENARFNSEVVAPLNHASDTDYGKLENGVVTTAPGFKDAFKQFVDGGWQGILHPAEYGGQGMPKLLATPCIEMVNSASLSFALCPLLTDGAIEALLTAGSDALKTTYIGPMIEGRWTGTMNLTEPGAGSDLAQVRTRAVPQGDGTYRVSGQKIFITYGEHDFCENIIHLVLARLPDAPEGVKGISLFVVPKFLVNDDGSLGKRNDVWCASIEHKLGIKASPTAVLLFGDDKGDVGPGGIGYLVGEENRGLEYMFVMMNAARFGVGMQGVAVAERAYQKAVGYAKDRTQSRDLTGGKEPVAIINHPDVKRLLMNMRAQTEGARALAYVAAAYYDVAHHSPDAEAAAQAQADYEFLVPIVKGWSTEMSIQVASDGVQVHGGMGFIEETGAAQYYRDARILTIYEGTTAIQANDFVGRKTARDGGALAGKFAAKVKATIGELETLGDADSIAVATNLTQGVNAFEQVVAYIAKNAKADPKGVYAGSVPYLKLAGIVFTGWQLARALLVAKAKLAGGETDRFFVNKIATARFFAEHFVSTASGLGSAIVTGGASVNALAPEDF
ncbi:acyl-CoA dehydrogenase [Derxia lacustris]|uniref:acyl-CoA dehydrogenase n=1 Tax=Derxia lacustris TaxID=764842 RepID=UPI000A16F616|nr:acyl-CoA dehydrogenase [Derxia lacustris]